MIAESATTKDKLKEIEKTLNLGIELASYSVNYDDVNKCIVLHADFTKNKIPYSCHVSYFDFKKLTKDMVKGSINNEIDNLQEKLEDPSWDYFKSYVSGLIYNKHESKVKRLGDRSPNPTFNFVQDYIESQKTNQSSWLNLYTNSLKNSAQIYEDALSLSSQ